MLRKNRSDDEAFAFLPCYAWLPASSASRTLQRAATSEARYSLSVHTADGWHASAPRGAMVFVELHGDEARSGERLLTPASADGSFVHGSTECCEVTSAWLGSEVQRMVVRFVLPPAQEQQGSTSWHLDRHATYIGQN